MHYIKVSSPYPTGGTLLSNAFVDHYMIGANGDYVKVYIYLLRMVSSGSKFSIPCLADVLELTERDVARALKYWEKHELLRIEMSSGEISSLELLPLSVSTIHQSVELEAQTEVPASNSPSSTKTKSTTKAVSKEASMTTSSRLTAVGQPAIPAMRTLTPARLEKMNDDERFSYLLYVTETFLGKPLSFHDINCIQYFYEDLSMSCDLIEYLVDYCVSNGKKNFRYIQTVAMNWYEEKITTVDQAKVFSKIFKKEYYEIMKAFGLNQNPAPVQEEYIKRWLDVEHYDLDLILEACNRTIKAINKPSFPYADTILRKWKDNQVETPAQAKAFSDQQRAPKRYNNNKAKTPNHNFTQRDYDFDALEQRLLEKQFAKETKED